MRVALIQSPYFLGHEGVAWGAGPERLVEAGTAEALRDAGHDVDVERVTRAAGRKTEVDASFEVLRLVAERVRAATERDAFPLVLGGNCATTIAVRAGLPEEDVGVVWLDAHPDFTTPEDTVSGHLDAMSLSILTGTGWDALRATIPGYRPVPEERVVLAGMRDAQPAEEARLERSGITLVRPDEPVEPALDGLRPEVSEIHLHFDLDVLDPSEGRANEYAAEGGLTRPDLEAVIAALGERFRVRSLAVTAYDPDYDPDGTLARTAIGLLVRMIELGVAAPEVTRA